MNIMSLLHGKRGWGNADCSSWLTIPCLVNFYPTHLVTGVVELKMTLNTREEIDIETLVRMQFTAMFPRCYLMQMQTYPGLITV